MQENVDVFLFADVTLGCFFVVCLEPIINRLFCSFIINDSGVCYHECGHSGSWALSCKMGECRPIVSVCPRPRFWSTSSDHCSSWPSGAERMAEYLALMVNEQEQLLGYKSKF